jgi:hypothetical protein
VLVASVAAQFVFATQAVRDSAPIVIAAYAALGAAIGVMLVAGTSGSARIPWQPLALAALAGALGWPLASGLIAANRYSDAPPGSEVLFLTVACWGAMLALTQVARSRPRVLRAGAVALALAAAAALVANWERPSSFSLFVRYTAEEITMLVAGLLWVSLIALLARSAQRGVLRETASTAAAGAVLAAGIPLGRALSTGTVEVAALSSAGAIAFGISTALAVAATLVLLRASGPLLVGAGYLLVPLAVASITLPEQLLAPLGPQPMVLPGVAGAVLASLAGVGLLLGARETARPAPSGVRLFARLLAGVAVAAALVALATPALQAKVNALLADGTSYRATFELLGWESAGGWLALCIALIGLGAALAAPGGRRSLGVAIAATAAAVAWALAGGTPMRTLTSFIPSEVQVDYGSEFATIAFARLPAVWAAVAVAGALGALALVWFSGLGTHAEGASNTSEGDSS